MVTTQLSQTSKTFVTFMTGHFGRKYITVMNAWTGDYRWQSVLKTVVEVSHKGYYEQAPRSFESTAYALGWVLETGRLNGIAHMAIRAMDTRSLLQLVGRLHDAQVSQSEMAAYLMQQFQTVA